MRSLFIQVLAFIILFGLLSITILFGIFPQGVKNQSIFFGLGMLAFIITAKMPFLAWKQLARPLYVLVILLLIFTFVLGKTTKGSTRWIDFGFVQFQPSQLAKPIAALYLAGLVSSWKYIRKKQVLEFVLSCLPFLALVFIQPDLGTTLVLAAVCASVFLFSRVSMVWILGILGLSLVMGALGWKFVLRDYQKERLQVFLAPQEDIQDSGCHANQALISVGSGKVTGRGLGRGVQSGLRFLPERQTDFFYAALSEETGFVGSSLTLALYAAFFFTLYKAIQPIHQQHEHEKLAALGILAMLTSQTLINLGMNLGLLPVTGITLPLLSLGGTSIVAICFSLGLLVSAVQAGTPRSVIELRSFL